MTPKEKIEEEMERRKCYEDDFREGDCETNIPPAYSRNYESKSVAAKMADGTWVGWTYWYGGGKHGNPEEIPWKEHAYFLTCVKKKKTITIRKFTKVEGKRDG